MADINIANLPDAGALSATDILHISQTSIDYKITIDDMSAEFGKAEIDGLAEDVSPLSSNFLVEAIDSDINNNKKVSLANVGLLFQTDGFFTSAGSIALTDVVIFRDGVDTTLSDVTVSALRSTVLDFTSLGALTTLATDDQFVVYDITGVNNARITTSNLQQQMLDTSTLTTMPASISTSDDMILYDDSANTTYQVSIATLDARWSGGGGGGGDAFLANTQTFTGTNTFSSGSGILTNRLAAASGSVLTISHTTTNFNNTISGTTCSFTNVGINSTGATVNGVFRGSNATAYSNRTFDIKGYLGNGWGFADLGGVRPLINGNDTGGVGTFLGANDFRWRNFFASGINVNQSAYIPTSTFINGAPLMNGAKISGGILPNASTSANGTVELATSTETKAGTDSGRAITPASLAGTVTTTNYSLSINAKAGTVRVTVFKIGTYQTIHGTFNFDSDTDGQTDAIAVNMSLADMDADDFKDRNSISVGVVGIRNNANVGDSGDAGQSWWNRSQAPASGAISSIALDLHNEGGGGYWGGFSFSFVGITA